MLHVAWDTETTGFSIYQEQIIQIGALCIRSHDGSESTFCELVKPSCKLVSREIEALTGIEASEVAKAQTFPLVFAQFMKWLQGLVDDHKGHDLVMTANNGHVFDVRILMEECKRNDVAWKGTPLEKSLHFDTKVWRKAWLKRKKLPKQNLSQGDVYRRLFNTNFPNAHQALGDARALMRIVTEGYMKDLLEDGGIRSHSKTWEELALRHSLRRICWFLETRRVGKADLALLEDIECFRPIGSVSKGNRKRRRL